MDRRALLGLPGSTASGPGEAAQASYIRFPTVTSTVVRRDGRRGVMSVETGIDVADAALRTRANQSAPRLRAAYSEVVQRAAGALPPGAPPNIDRLSQQLQAATDAVLGRAGARVLLGTVMVV